MKKNTKSLKLEQNNNELLKSQLQQLNDNKKNQNASKYELIKYKIQKNNDNIPNDFYKKCEELQLIIPFENIKEIDDNYIIKQALLLWYIALKYTDKYMNYINEHDKKLMYFFYENFGNKDEIHSQKFQEIYKLLK